jgi:hypothetical protein
MASKQHSTLTGSDLHITKIDATTGTEMTTPSETISGTRWVKTTGGTITPASNGTKRLSRIERAARPLSSPPIRLTTASR